MGWTVDLLIYLRIYPTRSPVLSAAMADVATPSGAAMFDAGGAEKKKPERLEKPEKPDEEVYKASLKKAEKDHADAMAKFVCSP